jgi:hypothetical protein
MPTFVSGGCEGQRGGTPTRSSAIVDPVTRSRHAGGLLRSLASSWCVESHTGGRAGELSVDCDAKLLCRRVSVFPALGRFVWATSSQNYARLVDGESDRIRACAGCWFVSCWVDSCARKVE